MPNQAVQVHGAGPPSTTPSKDTPQPGHSAETREELIPVSSRVIERYNAGPG